MFRLTRLRKPILTHQPNFVHMQTLFLYKLYSVLNSFIKIAYEFFQMVFRDCKSVVFSLKQMNVGWKEINSLAYDLFSELPSFLKTLPL